MKQPPQYGRFSLSLATALALGCVCLCSCREDAVVFHSNVFVTRGADLQNQEPRYRMIAAIADQPSGTWFFKLSGPIPNMEAMEAPWQAFLSSINFANAEPQWTLPEGWSTPGLENRPMPGGSAMRIANITTKDSDLSISVTSMPAGQQILPNVNRWRGQLGLKPISEAQMTAELSQLNNEQVKLKIFAANGPELTTRMGGRAPFAGKTSGKQSATKQPANNRPASGHPPIDAEAATNLSETKTTSPPIEFTAPADWTAGKTSAMVLGRWTRDTENGSVEILLLRMKPSDESWTKNVEAWAREVALKGDVNVAEVTESEQVAGRDARKVRLQGPPTDDATSRGVLAVMFADPNDDGFILKLSGNRAGVTDAEGAFQAILDSIHFQKNSG